MHIFFAGIGGVSMSALAKICLNKGYTVSGSDSNESIVTKELQQLGANIKIGHDRSNINDDIDMVVHTAAIQADNEELIAAKEKNKLILNRAVFLGQIMREYESPIAVAGTHGKTSTTSMLSAIFNYSNLDPTILVGGNLSMIGGNVRIGESKYFITEACEYVDSFLNFNPKVSIVLNIEEDHLDYFSGIEEIKASFNKFGKLLPNDGYFIINGDDSNTKDILHDIKATVLRFGQNEDNDVVIKNIVFDNNGCAEFEIEFKNESFDIGNIGKFKISVPGIHNVYNATAAILASLVLNVDIEDIRENVTKYKGVGRRFERKGEYNRAVIIDDYAHHPTEIKATLAAGKKITKNKLWCIFQPHTYSRTQTLMEEFSEAFYAADEIIITDIYAAREKSIEGVTSEKLANKIYQKGCNVRYIKEFDEIVEYLKDNISNGDVVITTGAGSVYEIAEKLI